MEEVGPSPVSSKELRNIQIERFEPPADDGAAENTNEVQIARAYMGSVWMSVLQLDTQWGKEGLGIANRELIPAHVKELEDQFKNEGVKRYSS